ncbi:arylsulfotransferase family protein [Mesorhizobium xinjiangense]|uniref:arylsulfotransferase family protein n=1 Tax=Mesorhizobium xinjiangense TaxID=2678685 RepID=UPI001F41E660|nr:arylsulfotransferase family protein [Mesorhizobium xinjiangense]
MLDRVLNAAFFAAIGALLFVAGTIVATSGIFPGPQISRAYEGGKALYSKLSQYQDVYQTDLWYPERRPDKGVVVKQQDRMQPGPTLYASGSAPAAFLIDADGKLIYSWSKPFSEIWTPQAGGVKKPQPDPFVYFRRVHVFPNGDLLALYEGAGDTPYGYGLVKLDRDSQVIWSYFGHAHHQFDIGPDGRIYVLTHEFVEDELKGFEHLASPRLEDFLVVLSPDGEELQKIRLLTAVAESEYRQLIYTVASFAVADPTHANTVEFVDREAGADFAFGDEGDVLLSFRALDAVAVLDPETATLKWATKGPWIGQHDPDILANGNLLLFDNYGNYSRPSGISRLIEFNPSTMEIAWQYAGTDDAPLDSQIRSDQQRLANGNTLITESNGGRIIEVTPRGEIVWEFLNPVRGGPDDDMIPIIGWAERLDPADLDPSLLNPQQQSAQLNMKDLP